MRPSNRFAETGTPNALAIARARLLAEGVQLAELTDTNPTRHGLFDERITEVLAQAARHAGHYDPDPRGPLPARTALAEEFGGEPTDYWLTASTSEAYSWLLQLLTDPGDVVAAPAPGYPLIDPLAHLANTRVAHYRAFYLHPHGWEYDLDSAAAALDDARLLLVVDPNNPTGEYVTEQEAARMAGLAAERGLPVIADEVFLRYRLEADQTASLAGRTETAVFALDGLSKLICAPQLKLGWIRLSGPQQQTRAIAPVLDRIADTFLSVNAVTANALPQLLALYPEILEQVTTRLRSNLVSARRILEPDGLRVRAVGGGWMLLIDVPGITDSDALSLQLLERARLSVHPGWFYDLSTPGTLAVSLLPREPEFDANMEQLKDALQGI